MRQMNPTWRRMLVVGCALAALSGCGDDDSQTPAPGGGRLDIGGHEPAADGAFGELPDGGAQQDARSAPSDATSAADSARDAALDATRDASPDATPDARPNDAAPPTDAAPLPPEGPARYPFGALHSPVTPIVIEAWQAIRARAPDAQEDVFIKVGASSTVSRSFMHCFATERVRLGGRDPLAETIAFFGAGDASGGDPYTRESLAATVGWSAGRALSGAPSPLDRELDATRPAFAAIMFGTNDLGHRSPDRYYAELMGVVDRLRERGVVPVLSTIMPRNDSADADALVPTFNAVARGIAQARQIPLVDLYTAVVDLPERGIGGDGVHLTTYRDNGSNWPCDLTPDGLTAGYNWRNLLTIEALDRLTRPLIDGAHAPDPPQPRAMATGGPDDPIRVTTLPFVDHRHTGDSPHRNHDTYPGCNAQQDESGPEYTYRIDLPVETTLRVWVLDADPTDADIHLLADPHDAGTCLQRAHREITVSLDVGTWYFIVDTFVPSGSTPEAAAGEYLLVIMPE